MTHNVSVQVNISLVSMTIKNQTTGSNRTAVRSIPLNPSFDDSAAKTFLAQHYTDLLDSSDEVFEQVTIIDRYTETRIIDYRELIKNSRLGSRQ